MAAHHHHHSHHQHGPAQNEPQLETGEAFTEKNRAHWDQFASSYTAQQWQRDMINDITSFLLSQKNWLGVPFHDPASQFETRDSAETKSSIRVLDYACGPGTLTSALAGLATEYVGIDLSANMVKAYNTRFAPPAKDNTEAQEALNAVELRTEELDAHAVVGNLLHPSNPTPGLDDEGGKFKDFDLAMVGLGFHHFEDPSLAARRLAERLKSGGVLFIIDFLPHGKDDPKGGCGGHSHGHHHNHDHSNSHQHQEPQQNRASSHPEEKKEDASEEQFRQATMTVAHHGFDEQLVKKIFAEDAGLNDVDIRIMPGQVLMKGHSPRTVFIAKGVKP